MQWLKQMTAAFDQLAARCARQISTHKNPRLDSGTTRGYSSGHQFERLCLRVLHFHAVFSPTVVLKCARQKTGNRLSPHPRSHA